MCLHKYCTLRCVLDGNRIRYDDKPVSVCVCACVSSCNQLCLPVLSFAPHCCPLSRFPRDHPAQCVPSSLPTQVCPLRRPPYLPSVFPRPHLPRALCIPLGLSPSLPLFRPSPPPPLLLLRTSPTKRKPVFEVFFAQAWHMSAMPEHLEFVQLHKGTLYLCSKILSPPERRGAFALKYVCVCVCCVL